MIGEIGGDAEERAADYIKANVTKPVVGYVAGFTAPEGKTMGHAGAIVSGSAGTAQAKKDALEAAGVEVGKTPSETAALLREQLAGCSSLNRGTRRDHRTPALRRQPVHPVHRAAAAAPAGRRGRGRLRRGRAVVAVRRAGARPTASWTPCARALIDAGARLVGLNFDAGDMAAGDRGLLSRPSGSARFRANVEVAVGSPPRWAARCSTRSTATATPRRSPCRSSGSSPPRTWCSPRGRRADRGDGRDRGAATASRARATRSRRRRRRST